MNLSGNICDNSSSPNECGCPDDVEGALPAERLDEEGAEGEVDDHADGGAHHRPRYEAASLLYRHPPDSITLTNILQSSPSGRRVDLG